MLREARLTAGAPLKTRVVDLKAEEVKKRMEEELGCLVDAEPAASHLSESATGMA